MKFDSLSQISTFFKYRILIYISFLEISIIFLKEFVITFSLKKKIPALSFQKDHKLLEGKGDILCFLVLHNTRQQVFEK